MGNTSTTDKQQENSVVLKIQVSHSSKKKKKVQYFCTDFYDQFNALLVGT